MGFSPKKVGTNSVSLHFCIGMVAWEALVCSWQERTGLHEGACRRSSLVLVFVGGFWESPRIEREVQFGRAMLAWDACCKCLEKIEKWVPQARPLKVPIEESCCTTQADLLSRDWCSMSQISSQMRMLLVQECRLWWMTLQSAMWRASKRKMLTRTPLGIWKGDWRDTDLGPYSWPSMQLGIHGSTLDVASMSGLRHHHLGICGEFLPLPLAFAIRHWECL